MPDISDEEVRKELNDMDGANVKILYRKLHLTDIPKGENARKRTIAAIVQIPEEGVPKSSTAILQNGRKRGIKGTVLQVAQKLVADGFFGEYYKIRPQTAHSWAETIRRTIAENALGRAAPTNVILRPANAPAVADSSVSVVADASVSAVADASVSAVADASVSAVADASVRESAHAGVQTNNTDLEWYYLLYKVSQKLSNIEAVLGADSGSMDLVTLLNCKNKLDICIENVDLCSVLCSLQFHHNLNAVEEVIYAIESTLQENVAGATIRFQQGIDAVEPFIASRVIPSAILNAARMLVEQHNAYIKLTHSNDKQAIVKDLQAVLQSTQKRKASVDVQVDMHKKSKY